MSDGVVSDGFQTRGCNELSSHTTKDYLPERTVASLKHGWQSLCRCYARLIDTHSDDDVVGLVPEEKETRTNPIR